MGPGPAPLVVHGMGTEPVPPHWPPLGQGEVIELLSRYPSLGTAQGGATITWHSPRPMSAAALVRSPGGTVFVKRHDPRVRTPEQLACEHSFAQHLRREGQPVPRVLPAAEGTTSVEMGGYVYEVHELARGRDVYRDALSWAPFRTTAHASAAGRALARFHRASANFDAPERRPGVLVNSTVLSRSDRPQDALQQLRRDRPALARSLDAWPVREDVARYLEPGAERRAALLATLRPWWGHGDWHSSNLIWGSARAKARVVGVVDLGLANLTFAPHDLALAIERNCIDWLRLHAGPVRGDVGTMGALVAGYEAVRPLGDDERCALLSLVPICHVEHALSEVEYFSQVVHSPAETELAYSYFAGHLRWFESPDGQELLSGLRSVLGHGS